MYDANIFYVFQKRNTKFIFLVSPMTKNTLVSNHQNHYRFVYLNLLE